MLNDVHAGVGTIHRRAGKQRAGWGVHHIVGERRENFDRLWAFFEGHAEFFCVDGPACYLSATVSTLLHRLPRAVDVKDRNLVVRVPPADAGEHLVFEPATPHHTTHA